MGKLKISGFEILQKKSSYCDQNQQFKNILK